MKTDWEKHFQNFLKQAGQEFRRVGTDLKQEVQKLLKEMKEPQNQEKLKKSLQNAADWAKATAKEVADMAQKYAEETEAFGKAKKRGGCGFKKDTSGKATWGEPVEKMSPPPAAKTEEAPVKAKKKASASAAKKAKTATALKRKTAVAEKKKPASSSKASKAPASKTKAKA
ncbi:MAG: hypothetical protein FWD46_05725 [Cystobacterineae bacterium]|nr:hypothetical protein [Cystobacterineae bacterium]